MKNILKAGEEYGRQMKLVDFGLLKICLFSLGLFTGSCITHKERKKTGALALLIYLITMVPLATNFFNYLKED